MSHLKRILIADDEEDLTWAISRSLQKSDSHFEIECVHDGGSVLDKLSQKRYQLIISDLRMPGCSGNDLIEKILSRRPKIHLIVVTAFPTPELNRLKEDHGFRLLEKPFDMSSMRRIVSNTLSASGDKSSEIRRVVEVNCAERRSSSLFVSRKEENGTIYFRDGEIVHAECGPLIGEKALFSILDWESGSFQVDDGATLVRRTIIKDWKTLLHH